MNLPVHSVGFSDALVILGAAGLVIPLFAKARVNPVIGFILVGMAAGPAGLGRLVPHAPWLFFFTISDPHGMEPFAELGIVLLLFSIGLELSFGRLWAMRRRLFGLGAAELFGSAAAIAAVAAALGTPRAEAVGLGLALALSSTALVLPLAGTGTPVGRAAFAMLLFEDLALVPIIFGLGAMAPGAGGGGAAALLVLVRGVATVAAMLVGGRFLLPRLFAQAARTKSTELFLSATLLVVILASVATAAAGLSPIVGALVAGILIAETDYHAEVEVLIQPFVGLALGVFLITVGMQLDVSRIAGEWRAVAAATAAVIAIKAAVTGGLLRALRFRNGLAVETGLIMAAPSETTLIVLGAGVAAGVVRPDTASFWQTCAAIGLAVTPLLAQLGGLLSRLLARAEPVETPPPQSGTRTVIVGYGRVGRLVGDMLARHGRAFMAVDADADAVARARAVGVAVMFGDAGRAAMLDKLDLARADALVLTMDDPVQCVRLTAAARARFPDLAVLARARDSRHASELYQAGASDAVPETLEASLQLSGATLVELGVAMGPVVASIHQRRDEYRAALRGDGAENPASALHRW